MKAAQINKYGGKEVLEINENAVRLDVQPGKILVEVHAAGVNPSDWKIREGLFQKMAKLQFPAILGGDFSGVVVEVGESVPDFKKGDVVYGRANPFNGGSGSFAEFAVADVKAIALKPKNINHIEAAAFPLVGVSAYQALVEHINLKEGQKILIHGGAGGIGSIAIQITKHLGAYVATTVSTEDKQYAEELGADEIIDYKTQSFEKVLSGYDAVFDNVGGETYKKSFQVLKRGGIIVSMTEQPNTDLMQQYGVRAISQFTQVTSERLSQISRLIDQGVIKVHIDKIFPLEQAGEALEYLKTGHPRGKVVIEVK